MSNSVEKSYSLILNSNPSIATALNPTTFNNEYSITLNNAVAIPPHATSCKVGLVSANIWNYDKNISASTGNKLYYIPNAIDGQQVLTIPDGYYGLSDLNNQISLQLQIAGYPADLFSFVGDASTQTVVITFNYDNTQINFSPSDSLRIILGFNARNSPTAGLSTAGEIDVGDNIAQFNSVNSFLISCPALVDDGININSLGRSIIGKVDITSQPNSLINYSPNQVLWIEVPNLVGNTRSEIKFSLLNELLQPVSVLDPFSFAVTIKWTE